MGTGRARGRHAPFRSSRKPRAGQARAEDDLRYWNGAALCGARGVLPNEPGSIASQLLRASWMIYEGDAVGGELAIGDCCAPVVAGGPGRYSAAGLRSELVVRPQGWNAGRRGEVPPTCSATRVVHRTILSAEFAEQTVVVWLLGKLPPNRSK